MTETLRQNTYTPKITEPVGKPITESVIKPNLEEVIKENIQLLKRAIDTLNIIKKGKNGDVNKLVQEIQAKISDGIIEENEFNGVKTKITNQSDDKYDIEFLNTDGCSDETLKSLQGLKLTVQKKDGEYKWGASFGQGKQEFHIGGLNEKLIRSSQVSALEGLTKPLVLIATPTGSGKTIMKVPPELVALSSGLRVVSVDHREDLVVQEYKDQKGAVLFNSADHIAYDNRGYKKDKTHNILSLDRFFAASNKIVNLDKLSQLIKDNNPENRGLKVDLKKKKITIGKNIEIYRDSYKVNGKEVKGSIFDDENLLVILDEIQEMVNQGQAYFVEIELLLLLASWRKINLVITTATPPEQVLDFINEEKKNGNAYIEAKSLKEREDGGTVLITVHRNLQAEEFVKDYVKYHNSEILERTKGEDYYYDHEEDSEASDIKQKIRKYIMWNLQSPRNRMTLVCSDCNESKKLLKDKILSPENQLRNLGDKFDFYQRTNLGNLSESIKSKLIDTFGNAEATAIDEVLKEFDFTGSIAESGVFAVAHGFIDDVIYCVTGMKLQDQEDQQLSKKRFSNLESLKSEFKNVFTKIENGEIKEGEIDDKISKYISSKRENENCEKISQVLEGMKIVWNLFVKYKDDDEKLTMLLSNHNLSREIHKMIPPDFSRLSEYNIFEIFAQNRSYGVFKYLKDNYDVSEEIGNKCDTLYAEYKRKSKEAEDCKRNEVDPAKKEWRNALEKVDELKSQIYNNVQGLQELLKESKATQDTAYRIYHKHQTAYDDLLKQAVVKKGELITKFKKEVVEALQDEEKYQLHKLRPICNEDAIANPRDKFSVGWRFDNTKISAFNDPWLYNVIVRETKKDDPQHKQQGVGRPGRKEGPIISSSYVDSSKIGSPDRVKGQLEYGSPFESCKATKKNKIDPQEFAEKMTKQIDGIIIANQSKGESAVVAEVIKCVFATHHELYNHSGYKNDETYKTFTQTLENVTSTLKEKCKKKNIVIGDSIVKFNIRGIESKIGKIADELISLSNELKPHEENRDKINEKLKIEGNFLKRLIIRLCTLVLHLWHWRLSPTQEQISEVLKKDDSPTIKDRVILRKAARQVANEMKPSEKKRKRQEDEKTKLTNKRIKLQDEYNGMHEYVGVIKRKDGVTQKEITESEKNSIIKKQLSGIEGELNKTNRSLSESKKKHDKDLKEFEALKGKIDGIALNINAVKDRLEKFIETQDKLSDLAQALRNVQKILQDNTEDIKSGSLKDYDSVSGEKIKSLQETTKKIEGIILSEKYKDFFNKESISTIKRQVATLHPLCTKCITSHEYSEKDNIQTEAETLKEALEETIGYIEKKTIPEEKDSQELTKEIHENIKNHENQTQIERLCSLVDTGIANFSNKKVQTTCADVKRLLSYLNKFTEEKTRLEKIQGEQEELDKKIKELNDEKEKLQNPDADQQMDMCRKLLVYKSINKNYDLRRCMWSLTVSLEFFKNKPDRNDYISSPVFLELFTNIVMPLMNDGTLKIALDIMDPNGDSSAKKVEKINKFYQNLVDRNFDEIKDDVSNVLECMDTMILPMIACTKFNHYTNGLSKDLHLIKNITFSKFDPFDFIATKLQNSSGNNGNNDLLSVLKNVLVESLKGEDPNQLLQGINPITQGIYTKDINSGTPIFSTLNFLMKALPFVAAKKDVTDNDGLLGKLITMFSDTSAKRATKVIEKFGKGKDQDDIRKVVYENLMIFLNEWKGCGSQITWSGKSLAEEQSAQDSQAYGQKARLASQQEYLPADRLTDPSVHRLDSVQAVAPG